MAIAVFPAGCGEVGFGAGQGSGDASIRVTTDYGRDLVGTSLVGEVGPSTTVLRGLEQGFEIETSYGGGFVDRIEGIGSAAGVRSEDWFYFANGIEAGVGAAEFTLEPGDRVWWDFRDWTDVMYVGSVVGSFPEPLRSGYRGREWPVRIVCDAPESLCRAAQSELRDDGVRPATRGRDTALEVVVGEWERIRGDHPELGRAPGSSGVFGRFTGSGGAPSLELLDARKVPVRKVSGGLVASVSNGSAPPTWFVTGTGSAGLREAIELLEPETLARAYAVAAVDGEAVPLPVREGEGS